MPYVKAVPLSRIAGSALKSFTHGYAQTVVAASQSSYAAQNTPAGPLADSLISKFRKAERNKYHNVYHGADGLRQASTATAGTGARPETSHPDSGLDKYFDAWQKHQRNETNEWQQFQFAKRIEWQPPSTIPAQAQETANTEVQPNEHEAEVLAAPSLKRSYTTSALDNFSQAFINDEAAGVDALEHANNAISEEIQRSKEDADQGVILNAPSTSSISPTRSFASGDQLASTPGTVYTPVDNFASTPEADFTHMSFSSSRRPSSMGGSLLPSRPCCVLLTPGKHEKAPKALEVYSDMLRRKVQPDTDTYSALINILATRALEASALRQGLEERLARYGGLEQPGKFMFRSSESEHSILLEDSSLSIALKLFDRAARAGITGLASEACASLTIACAEQGRLPEMARLREYMQSSGATPPSCAYPPVIAAFGLTGDLKTAVAVYDEYKNLCIANNAGENNIARLDNEVYSALVKSYGAAGRLKSGLKFLASVQSTITSERELLELREVVAAQALLPLALQDETFGNAFDLTQSLSGNALNTTLAIIAANAADRNLLDVSQRAFDTLVKITKDVATPATAMLAMHIRNASVEAAEPYWRVLETAPATVTFVEPTTMRAVALIGLGQAERGLRQTRRMFSRIRDQQAESGMEEAVQQMDEALEMLGNFMLRNQAPLQPQVSVELLMMMAENGGLITPIADHLMARLGPDQIGRLSPADLESVLRIQVDTILQDVSPDIAGPARFGCLLENVISRSIMPAPETETAIEKALINIDRAELSRLWNAYRYPQTPVMVTPAPFTPIQPAFDDSFDPYAARTDVKASNAINDLLERPQGRRLTDALAKFKNMRRIGRVPRMFTYGKLIESAAKEHNLSLAHEILEMAKQDVPFDTRYRVVRFGWQQILDHMIAGCLTIGRRDLASQYHQDLLDMGAAPSANTFGLYITTLKENTRTFDEASEAVKIFIRAKSEGVEPSSFLFNALIGKLGKARRIDDCLFYFAEMRNLGVRPTSVTYGTIVNALVRVSDEKFAEEIFEEMEACTNYKPRPAPYHSMMQFFLTTKRDRSKVLSYYERMRAQRIEPTMHTYKLLIDTHATLEPVNLAEAEAVLTQMQRSGAEPDAVHYASLIHAKGCVVHDLSAARQLFDSVIEGGRVRLQPCVYQAMFESLNANHAVAECEPLLADMRRRGVEFTPYIANALIHGWTLEKEFAKAKEAFERLPVSKREPSTYEAMVRAHLAAEDRVAAKTVVREALGRGYPSAVAGKIAELVR
ncbi:hypothetical protein LTR53_014537 [Teratosphaeriaceae sp. CCFEE 6253]|nr:hypothetical protein LTR53_014537 [Teratosphaeriaceae sp. CCFEE 6253]